MRDSKSLIIGVTGSLVAGTIYLIERHILPPENNLNDISFYKKYPLSISILILLVVYLFAPYLIKKIKTKYKNYKEKRNRPINLIRKVHETKYIKTLSNITKIEKDILFLYYIEPNELCHKFDDYFPQLEILNNLCDKGILYKCYDNIKKDKIKYNEFCITEIIKKYLDSHRKLLK